MPMYDVIENYSDISGSLWQCYVDGTALTGVCPLDHFPDNRTLLKSKQNIAG